jgi:ABC-2 type transport system permease protein
VVGIFAGLKWRLVTSRLRATSGATKIWMIVGFVVALIVLGFFTVGIGSLRLLPEDVVPIMVTLLTMQLVGWVLTPLVAFGVDETVDPQRFALLPLRPQTLQTGLLITSLIGYLPVANMIGLLGVAVALSVPWSLLPVALVCVAVQMLLCVVLSRAASTSMAALMSSRRGRDLGMLVGLGIFVLYMVFVLFINAPGNDPSAGGGALRSGVLGVANVLQWTPPGALATLPGLIAEGQWGQAAAAAAIALGALALAWWWWGNALRRNLTTVSSSTEGSSPSHGAEDTAVAIGVVGTMKVVAGRDRVLAWRDPMRRMPWLMVLIVAVMWPFLVIRGQGAVFAVALGALMCGAQAGAMYGFEGSALWLHLQTVTDRVRARGEVIGHAIVALIPGMLIVVIGIAVQAVVHDDYANVPAALGACLAALFGSVAVSCYMSAAVPYAMPQSRKSMFASSVPGQKGRTFAAGVGFIIGGLIVALPTIVCVVLSLVVAPVWGWVALVVGLVTGPIALVIAVRLTADRFLANGPEIFELVRAGDRV